MIDVKHLTKRYGAHTAVDDLTFTIEKGVVYGLLGPNGAGKSTTMNIITGCLGASEGEVSIDGHNVMDEPMKTKRLVGYLPEQPPLYQDMTPDEYLRFVLGAKGVKRRDWPAQLESVIEKTQIQDVRHRLIRNLSKGYKQRVGIAQALLGDPEVIILDEPTVGLDPAQIIEIRELIRSLGHDHTMILSSHILSEVQAVCDHIMIISKGKLAASDTSDNLTRLFAGNSALQLEIRGSEADARAALAGHDEIGTVEYSGENEGVTSLRITPPKGEDVRETVFRLFAGAGPAILEMRTERATLEDVFLELTASPPAQPTGKPKRGSKGKKEGEQA